MEEERKETLQELHQLVFGQDFFPLETNSLICIPVFMNSFTISFWGAEPSTKSFIKITSPMFKKVCAHVFEKVEQVLGKKFPRTHADMAERYSTCFAIAVVPYLFLSAITPGREGLMDAARLFATFFGGIFRVVEASKRISSAQAMEFSHLFYDFCEWYFYYNKEVIDAIMNPAKTIRGRVEW
jgi:hypothetical protein